MSASAGPIALTVGIAPAWATGWPAPAAWGAFMLAVAVLNATPGVDVLLTVSRTLQTGARAGLAAALGIVTGCAAHALAAALGLAAVLALHAQALQVVQWIGAAYLVWLGVGLLRAGWQRWRRPDAPDAPVAPEGPETVARATRGDRPRLGREFRTGLLTNLLNPKVVLFFLAFLPQFVPQGAPHPTAVMLALGAVFVLQSALFLAVLVALTHRLAGLARRRAEARAGRMSAAGPAGRRVGAALQATGGLLFIALAARLAGGDLSAPAPAPVGVGR